MYGDWRDTVIRLEERQRALVPFGLAVGLVVLVLAGLATWLNHREALKRQEAVAARRAAATALEALVDDAWQGAVGPGLTELRARVEAERPLGGAETKLIALDGLVAVGRGALDHARARAAELEARRAGLTPHARALRGALAAAAGDPHEAIDELSRALDAGLNHPDLRGWRAVARAAEGLAAWQLAREVLADLEVAASFRRLRPPEEQAEAKARAVLAAAGLEAPDRGAPPR